MTTPDYKNAWKNIEKIASEHNAASLFDLFKKEPDRASNLSFSLGGLFIDFSKTPLTTDILGSFVELANAADLDKKQKQLFSGEKINSTENRAVLHTALRSPENEPVSVDGKNISEVIHATLSRAMTFADTVRDSAWRGYTGKPITHIVNIGIGGSSLGPQLVTEALRHFHHPRLKAHFVSNVEASDLECVISSVPLETTLFIIVSKTFTTAETLQNAHIARKYVTAFFKDDRAVEKHFVAVSTNSAEVKKFGISESNMFPFWDWVGGRYSVWSSVGLSAMIMIGPEHFSAFLSGAHTMDRHFLTAPLKKNIPFLMAALGVWYRNFSNYPAYACIPYHSALRRLPAWLQQLDMESNGKQADCKTGPLVFGEPGTDSQHSFFQWLHQGTDVVPVDFIASIKTPYGSAQQQNMLLANCLAQSKALMMGQPNTSEPHRHFPGNRPSTTILLDDLTPKTLGALLALYEHKVFVQGVLWSINSFDQWGVELGKTLAKTIQKDIDEESIGAHDPSTASLMKHILSHR